MGKSMALNMARRGFELAVFDLNPDAMRAFTEFNKCRQAREASDTANDAEIFVTVLPGPEEIDSGARQWLGPKGFLRSYGFLVRNGRRSQCAFQAVGLKNPIASEDKTDRMVEPGKQKHARRDVCVSPELKKDIDPWIWA